MVRLTSWLRSEEPKEHPSPDTTPKEDLWAAEISNLEDAFAAADLILDDNMDLAESRLKASPSSSYHHLALAVISFIRSILGFEKEVMALASSQLADCEARALADQRRVQSEFSGCVGGDGGGKCGVYPPGTEYALVHAESMLMGAVVGVLHESLAEGVKSFYKLRKAYFALEGIVMLETKGDVLASKKSLAEAFAADRMPGSFGEDEWRDSEESDAESASAASDGGAHSPSSSPRSSASPPPSSPAPSSHAPTAKTSMETEGFTNPRDVFIHSGASMCFGTLLFIFTLVPPALSKLLNIVGFRGDRERGIRMLWASSASPNVHGAVAGVVLLSYYNGLLGLADILPPTELFDTDAEIVGPPVGRCEELLKAMRARYPHSGFWQLERSKMLANERRLRDALGVLRGMPASNMKQVDALVAFELALDSMFAMEWGPARDAFLRCLELNEWSRTMYYFLAGCAEVELYRDAFHAGNHKEAAARKGAAEELFGKAPGAAGKKRLLAKQLPFEVFVLKKLKKWEARAAEMGGSVSLVDVIGASPAQEMVYLWNGGKRLDESHAERALGFLEWGRCTGGEEVVGRLRGFADEQGVRGICRAALLRVLERIGEARGELEGVLEHDRSQFKGPTKEDYVLPSAHYEMAALAWTEAVNADPTEFAADSDAASGTSADGLSLEEYKRAKVDECQARLDRAAGWESFVLDARCGMRVQTGGETLKWYRRRMGWV